MGLKNHVKNGKTLVRGMVMLPLSPSVYFDVSKLYI
jgi:hypothetical protein